MDEKDDSGTVERMIESSRIEEFEDRLLALVGKAADEGMSHDEVMFAFARSAYRLATPAEPPPDGRVYRLMVTSRSVCGCLLEVEVCECDQPEDYTGACHDGITH